MMSSVNVLNPRVDGTVRIFDEFYSFDIQVPAAEYDVVYGYFASVFTEKRAAADFTTTIFRIAQETNTPVLTVLDQIAANDTVQLTANICYYLNGLRSPTTLLGINSLAVPNAFVARNVMI